MTEVRKFLDQRIKQMKLQKDMQSLVQELRETRTIRRNKAVIEEFLGGTLNLQMDNKLQNQQFLQGTNR